MCIVDPLDRPELQELVEQTDKKYLEFISDNKIGIIKQAKHLYDEIPEVPLFDSFLNNGFGDYIQSELERIGYKNSEKVAKEIVSSYRGTFYRSSLPNILENIPYENC